MNDLVKHQFQHFAQQYIAQPEFSGYHSVGGVWVYHHNFVNLCWKMWQECQALNDVKLKECISELTTSHRSVASDMPSVPLSRYVD